MKIKLLVGVLLWVCGFGNNVFAQNYFAKNFYELPNFPYDIWFNVSITNSHGETYVTGEMSNLFNLNGLPFVMKFDSSGNLLWSKRCFIPDDITPYSIVNASEGGVTIAGMRKVNYFRELFLSHIDSSGTLQWSKGFRQASEQVVRQLINTPDNGYLLTCNSSESILIKTDSTGNLEWTESMYPDTAAYLQSTAVSKKGNYISVGYIDQTLNSPFQMFIWKVNSMGKSKKMKLFNQNWGMPQTIKAAPDSGFYITAVLADTGLTQAQSRATIIKIDKHLNLEWVKRVDSAGFTIDLFYDIWHTMAVDSDFIIVKISKPNDPVFKSYLLKIDTAGNLLWTKKMEQTNVISMNVINQNIYMGIHGYGFLLQKMDLEMNSSCFIYNDSLSLTNFNMTDTVIMLQHHPVNEIDTTLAVGAVNLVIYDSVHCNSLNIYQLTDNSALRISPNPATDKLYISFPATTIENITVKIFSITGEVLFAEENKTSINYFTNPIDVTKFANGIYFLNVQTISHGERSPTLITRKIIIHH
ncbi:MAG: T9SS type A sorting domain-containing protein [Bacteroidota bacterium]